MSIRGFAHLVESSDLALHRGGVEPGVLVADQPVPDFEHVEDPDLDRRTTTGNPRPLAVNVTGDDRFVDDVASPVNRLTDVSVTSGIDSMMDE